MAPESSLLKRKPRENQYIFDLGVRGRKTGLTLADTGIRDENGLEPMDHLFSSPEKSTKAKKLNGTGRNANATISSEEDMDLAESTIPEPNAVLTERKQRVGTRLPPPRSKSPIKTFLQSPARRNPSLGPNSSPIRGSIVLPRTAQMSASVRRKLDFSNDNLEANVLDASISNASPQKRTALANLTNGTRQAALGRSFSPVDAADDGEDETAQTQDDTGFENAQESFQMIDGGENEEFETQQDKQEEQEEQAEPEYAAQLEPPKKGRGKARPKESEIVEVPAKRGRGRKKRESILPLEQDVDEPLAKRTRRSLEGGETVPEVGPKAKATKVGKTNAAAKTAKPKAAAMKAKLAPISEAESPEVQRGPPMPRNNRGLIILRRETPLEGAGFKQTRSGRNSIKPVAYWKNERIEYSEDENEDQSGGRFLLPRIKGVVRADEVDERRPKKSCHKPSKGKKRKAIAATAIADMEEDNDDEAEPWEAEPGRVFGDIRIWDPEDQTGMKAEEIEEEIALSSAAIITRDIANATFKFAKTLTLPFFGSGMVDLPPGAVKKPKNSRKMQMVFFVFYGRVEVTVNDTTFRIGKGGMWQVPRGNFYTIANDYDTPARIFFSQGCEVIEELPGSQGSQ